MECRVLQTVHERNPFDFDFPIMFIERTLAVLDQLRIQNFKGWQDTGVIRMAPITLFFGANSSGKSSIGHFLLMLKQTIESSDRKAVFHPGTVNSPFRLGSYRDMVFGNKPDRMVAFEYRWSLPNRLKIVDPLSEQEFCGDTLAFAAQAGLNPKRHSLIVDRLQYRFVDQGEDSLAIRMMRDSSSKSTYEVETELYPLTRYHGRTKSVGAPVRFYGFPDEIFAYYENADFVHFLNLWHEKLFHKISYLGPLRTRAERLYSWGGFEPDSVGYAGENTVAAMLSARDRRINLGFNMVKRPFEEIIARKLMQMGLIDEFKITQISEHRQEFEVRVRTRGSNKWADIPDVGFGISQVLPVLVQCFYAPSGSIIFMEQPEIHLHPSAQSALADVMIDVINSRMGGKDRGIQLIIETHSEHFLRRLQRRIAEDRVPTEKVAAYFANVSGSTSKLEALQLDEFGNIKNWPKDFFGDEMGDILNQAKAAMKKRMQRETNAESGA
ncbi:MAG: DUF3696 domain-containing protein [Rhodobacteraceae bacterium]|nr:DUF3696 domain-containing protein [Paracoccaceae bacterium]